ncbi:pyridoxal-phosphate dependent enzyme [Caldiplasma sukawensis]
MELTLEEEKPPGATPFFRALNVEKSLKLRNVFFKFEGANVTGTQKDRIAELHVKRAIEQGYDTISVATCGNYGASISYYASIYGIKAIVAIPSFYSNERSLEIMGNGADVIIKPMKYEDLVEYVRDLSKDNGWYDSSPGSENSYIDFMGYENIAYEIVDELNRSPNYVAVPVGNGTTLAGIFNGFKKLYRTGKIKALPKMIGSTTSLGNAILYSWKHGYKRIQDLEPSRIVETTTNEPLVAFRSLDGQRALNAIYESRGAVIGIKDMQMIKFARLIESREGIKPLPASASALAAIHKIGFRKPSNSDSVVVLTGRSK